MQILEKVGLPKLFILLEEKIKKVVLPSYVGASHVTATSVQLPKEVYSDTNKALMNSFASITAFNVQNVSIDNSVMISCYYKLHTCICVYIYIYIYIYI